MNYFAEIVDSTVTQVIVIDIDALYPDSEPIGQAFIASIGIEGEWLQTSYNNNFRGQYAGQGMTYDPTLDEFVSPQPEEPLSE